MKLYNTLHRQVEEVKPIKDNQIGIYSCGPTVYDRIHIGNLSTYIFEDTLHRALEAEGLSVKHVMNFTDVDDKTIKAAQEKYPNESPLEALKQLTRSNSTVVLRDFQQVNIDVSAYTFVKATESIEAMQRLISELYGKGFAYLADDGVYFSIEAYKKSGKTYGQLSHISQASTAQQRIANDEYDKQNAHDFALWKKQKQGEPAWPFKLADHDIAGRPGWHIECSAMSESELGQPFDIHTGGVDLIFPHHENEIAQSTAGQEQSILANSFMHSEHILIDGQKMSKSLNNFITLDDVIQRGFDPLAFRLLILQSHFRSQAHFSWENLESAAKRLLDLKAMAALRYQPRGVSHDTPTFALEDVPEQLLDIMSEDLNTPAALAVLSGIVTQLQAVHIEKDMVDHFEVMLKGIDQLLGLKLLEVEDINDQQKALISERESSRQKRDWQKADELRRLLADQQIGLSDAAHGPIWYRLS